MQERGSGGGDSGAMRRQRSSLHHRAALFVEILYDFFFFSILRYKLIYVTVVERVFRDMKTCANLHSSIMLHPSWSTLYFLLSLSLSSSATNPRELERSLCSLLRFPSPQSEWESRLLGYDRVAWLGCFWNPNHEYHIWCVVLLNCFISQRT